MEALTRTARLCACVLWLSAASVQAGESRLYDEAERHYQQGLFALQSGHSEGAITEFEAALLYNPSHAGALIDLVVAQCAVHQEQSCDAGILQLQQQFKDVPALTSLTDRLAPKRWNHLSQFSVGYSDNLNKGLSDKQLNMQVQGLPVTLTLNDNSLSKQGVYQDITHFTTWQSTSLFPKWEAWGYGYVRQLESLQQNQVYLINAGIKRRWQDASKTQRYALGAGLTQLSYDSRYRYHSPSVLLDWQKLDWAWKPKLELVKEYRALERPAAASEINTIALSFFPLDKLQIRLETLQEVAQNNIGINNARQALQVLWQVPLTSKMQLSFLAQTLLSKDEVAYAPPIVDVAREYQQQRFQVGLTGSIDNHLSWQCAISKGWQDANHPLFAWRENNVQCGFFVAY